jgi:hypothetical protein
MDNKKVPKSSQIFSCELCDYNTCRKSQYERHLTTPKHNRILNDANLDTKKVQQEYTCECGNTYLYFSGLCKHKKKCIYNTNTSSNIIIQQENSDISLLTNLVLEVVKNNNDIQKQNNEFQKQIFESFNEVIKNSTNNNIINNNNNTNTINSNNKSFNLNFFLNETCKDAMNLSEFIDSMKLQLTDLESVGKLGFVDGISNIIIKNLEALDIEKRPIHCCDAKRETVYIKDQDKWEKDDSELKRMKDLVRTVRDRNILLVATWRDLYPECVKSNSKKTAQFNQICMEAFGGETGGDKGTKQEKEEKIISRIAKSVVIDKRE